MKIDRNFNLKNGDIVWITDLDKPGMIMSCYEIFEACPAFLLRMVEPDPSNGGMYISYCKRTLDMLEMLPEEKMEEASVSLFVSPMEEIYSHCSMEMNFLEGKYRSISDAVTVRDLAQRDAGAYSCLWRIKDRIEKIMTALRGRGCALNWYVARDSDGTLSLFSEKPSFQNIIPNHAIWYRKEGSFRTTLPKEYLSDLDVEKSRPVRVIIEMI